MPSSFSDKNRFMHPSLSVLPVSQLEAIPWMIFSEAKKAKILFFNSRRWEKVKRTFSPLEWKLNWVTYVLYFSVYSCSSCFSSHCQLVCINLPFIVSISPSCLSCFLQFCIQFSSFILEKVIQNHGSNYSLVVLPFSYFYFLLSFFHLSFVIVSVIVSEVKIEHNKKTRKREREKQAAIWYLANCVL